MARTHTAALRWPLLGLLVFGMSCSVLFDYEETPQAGGAGQGGSGGSVSCSDTSECDDGDSCTQDTCAQGSCVNETLGDGEACVSGGGEAGTCASGECIVSCDADNPDVCDDGEPCTVDSCDLDLGRCSHEAIDDQVAPGAQTTGDCLRIMCVAGVSTEQADDTDVPDDGNACTDDLCSGGVPSNEPLLAGTMCGANLICDDNGVCVGCNAPTDCPGSDTFCQTRTCVAQQCGVNNTADGTALPSQDQTAGDCKEIQCDGAGSTKTVNRSNGTSCDDNAYCNGSDSCVGGNCSNHGGNPCPGADGDSDCSESCSESNDNCSANDPNGSSCSDGLYCNGSDTCSSGSCSSHSGNPCPGADGDSDCSESCNENNNNCSGNDPNGSSCSDGLYCNGSDTCSSGSCSSHSGNPCPGGDGDNDCSESCNEGSNNCTANDPNYLDCNGNPNDNVCCHSGVCSSGICPV